MKIKFIKANFCILLLLITLFTSSGAIAQTLTITSPTHRDMAIHDLSSIEGIVQTTNGKVIQSVEISIRKGDKPYDVWANTTTDGSSPDAVNHANFRWVSAGDNPKNIWIPVGPLMRGVFEGSLIWTAAKSPKDLFPSESEGTLLPGNYTISARCLDAKGIVRGEVQERITVRKK